MRLQKYVIISKWLVYFGFVAFIALVASLTSGQTLQEELMKRSSIVFIGTLEKIGAVSFQDGKASKNTAMVKIDHLLEKPPAVSVSVGQHIMVELKDPSAFEEGIQATFYTEGWVFGKRVTVREVGHELQTQVLSVSAAEELEKRHSKIRQNLKDAELQARIKSADLVLVGHVTSIRPAAVPVNRPKIITEHDPDWQEAFIRITSRLKGANDSGEVVLRFPGSLDVAYYGAPKFKVGEKRVFLLEKDAISKLPRPSLAGKEVDAYTALSPLNVFPIEEANKIRALLTQ